MGRISQERRGSEAERVERLSREEIQHWSEKRVCPGEGSNLHALASTGF